MKPAPFDYAAPATLDEALELLAQYGDEATVLAGGQSLVPLLNFRLVRPTLVVDLNRIAELEYLRDDGVLRVGALARQAALVRRDDLLGLTARNVGHAQTRIRGTVCGSAAYADPAAQLPCALLALQARFHARSSRSVRVIEAADFFRGYLTTALEPDELLVEIEVPRHAGPFGFAQYARAHGDWPIAGVAVAGARVALLGAGSTPVPLEHAELGSGWKRALFDSLLEQARS
jgi:CO/xanthine dehydrogenase FAD-binding subunit